MKCHTLHDRNFAARWWHRRWCRECRTAQPVDTFIRFGLMQMKAQPLESPGLDGLLSALPLQQGGRNVRCASGRVAGIWLRRKARNVGIALVLSGVWWQYMNYVPPISIPAKIAPRQNAFDIFKVAGAMIAADKSLADELNEAQQAENDPPTRERRDARLKRAGKALPTLQELAQAVKPNGLTVTINAATPLGVLPNSRPYDSKNIKMQYTQAEKQALLNSGRDALAKLREGLKYPYLDVYPRRWDMMFPYYGEFRTLARLLRLEAELKAAKGDWRGAMQSSLDAIQVGMDMGHGSTLIGRLTGIACEAIGQQEAWKVVEHLDAKQAQEAIARLQAIRAYHAPFVETMQEEGWYMQEALAYQMRRLGWRGSLANLVGGDSKEFTLAMLGWSNRVVLRDIAQVGDENVRRARLRYAQSSKLPEIKLPLDPIVQMLSPVFEQAQYKDVYLSETQSALLVTALALRAYRQEHGGKLPERLEQLTPRYLAQIPTDPFASDNGTLRYHTTPILLKAQQPIITMLPGVNSDLPTLTPYTLYSVGPDGRDDGGSPVDLLWKRGSNYDPHIISWESGNSEKNRFNVQPDSQGDIVAGVNTK